VVNTWPQHTTWPGVKTNASVVGGQLVASATDLFYGADEEPFYGMDTSPFYALSQSAGMRYEWDVITDGPGRLTLSHSIVASSYTIEYARDNAEAFYGISGATWTRVYDLKTGAWFDASSKSRGGRYRVGTAAHWGNAPVFGDIDYGRVSRSSREVYDEDGDEMVWTVQQPVINAFPARAILAAVYGNFVSGVGTATGASQDITPKVMLSLSRDGGATWGAERQVSLGALGKVHTRAVARRLGLVPAQGTVLRWSISAAVAFDSHSSREVLISSA
jgi:hypothetical protein